MVNYSVKFLPVAKGPPQNSASDAKSGARGARKGRKRTEIVGRSKNSPMQNVTMSSSTGHMAGRLATRATAVLSAESIKIVKATAPVVAPRAEELTKHFYGKMFKNNPEVLAFFNQANQKKERGQPQALAHAVVAYASNIENLSVLGPAVEAMAVKHCGLQVLPEVHFAPTYSSHHSVSLTYMDDSLCVSHAHV